VSTGHRPEQLHVQLAVALVQRRKVDRQRLTPSINATSINATSINATSINATCSLQPTCDATSNSQHAVRHATRRMQHTLRMGALSGLIE
jgi:hypothetical protein